MKRRFLNCLFILVLIFLVSCGNDSKEQMEAVQTGPKEIVWNIDAEDIKPLSTLEKNDYNSALKIISSIRNKSNSQSINYLLDSLIASKDMVIDIIALSKKIAEMPSSTSDDNYNETMEILDFYNKNSDKLDSLIKTYIENSEKSYKANEIVKLKPELTEGDIAIIYPDHFKTISGFMKVIGAQMTLISSYNVEDKLAFGKFLEENDKYTNSKDLVIFVKYLKEDFKNSSLFNKNIAKQALALNYMKKGIKELEVSLRAIPVFTTEEERLKNVFAINDGDRNTATYVVDALSSFLKDNGGTLKIGENSYTANLNKLYQLDLKNLIDEFLKETDEMVTSDSLRVKIKENISKSTFQGLFPNKIPQDLLNRIKI